MFDIDALCPHCDGEFKLKRIGLETREFVQCPHCRGLIKLDLNDPEKRAIRVINELTD
jgi:Zn-finger nucleic acid-binding protein